MVIYILYFIFLAILAIQYEFIPFKNKYLIFTVILLLALLAGLRGINVSKDYYSYSYIFENVYDLTENGLDYLTVFEPGFIAIIIFFRAIFEYNYIVVIMLFYAFSSLLLKIYAINRLSINPYLAILFYFSYYFLIHEMTQIRIGLASGIFLISLIPFLKGKRITFVCLILLATLLHYSAIFYLLLLLFNTIKFNRSLYFFALILSIILAIVKLPLLNLLGNFDPANLSDKFNTYVELSESGSVTINVFNSLNICNILCCVYLIFFVSKETILGDSKLLLFLKCNILSIFLLSLLAGVPVVSLRFSQLFGITQIFLFTYLVKYLPAQKFNVLILVLLAGFFFYITGFYGNLLHPYQITNFKYAIFK
jgi:hypothetical protein